MPVLRLFGPAREIAGIAVDDIPAASVAEITEAAVERYGESFSALLATCKVWVNGEVATPGTALEETDEVAILPPVSGG